MRVALCWEGILAISLSKAGYGSPLSWDCWRLQGLRILPRLSPIATPLLLAWFFPELELSQGIIESPLYSAITLQREMMGERHQVGRWLI